MNKKRMDYISSHNLAEVENFLSEHYTDADFSMSVNVLQPITAYIRQTKQGTKDNCIPEVSRVAVKIDGKTQELINRLSKMAWCPVHE